jgi:hypothetical protein
LGFFIYFFYDSPNNLPLWDWQGPVNMSTPAILISPGLALTGTVSITSAELYFEVRYRHHVVF